MKKRLLVILLALVLVLSVALVVACDKTPNVAEKAKDLVFNMYRNDKKDTPADYELPAQVLVDGTPIAITWTTDNEKVTVDPVEGNTAKVLINITEPTEASPKGYDYKLTATMKDAEGNEASCTFERSVPDFRVLTWKEYAATEKGKTVTVEGIVNAILSKKNTHTGTNCIYLQDDDGGYYIYGMKDDPADLGIELGHTVRATGTMDIYSGTLEVKDATCTIRNNGAKSEVKVTDYTEIFTKAGADMKNTALVSKQGLLVTIKGVTLKAQSESDVSGGYYRFTLGEGESYIRISSSTNAITAAEEKIIAGNHKANYTADVTGLICVYNGAFYLTPASKDAISNLKLPPAKDNAEALSKSKNALDILSGAEELAVVEDTVIELPAKGLYDTVAIAWSFKADTTHNTATIADGKLTITLGEAEETLTVVATLSCGSETPVTKEFKLKVDAATTQEYLPENVTEAKEGTFKLALYQAKLGKYLYADGTVNSSEYLAATDKADKAADVVVAGNATDGYTLKIGTKFIEVYENSSAKIRIRLTDASNGKWKWNADAKVFTWEITGSTTASNNAVYYLGTYNTFNTISASKISFITGDNASKVGTEQFPAYLGNYEFVKEA